MALHSVPSESENAPTTEDWASIGSRYKGAASALKDVTERPHIEEFLKFCLPKDTGNPPKLLDVGCGCGKYTEMALQLGYRNILATDVATSMVKEASDSTDAMIRMHGWQNLCNVIVKECSITEMTSQLADHANSCDAAICVWVLANLPDLESVRSSLHQLVAMLKPGGRLLILDAHPVNHCDLRCGSFVRDMQGHDGYFSSEGQPFEVCMPAADGGTISFQNRRYTFATWINLLAECGLRVYHTLEPRRPDAEAPASLVLCCVKSRSSQGEEKLLLAESSVSAGKRQRRQ